jgi:uracil-DNA glycosylase family 4
MAKYVPGYGPLGAKIAVVTDCPQYEEEQSGKQFTGAWSKEFDRLARDTGIRREECWLTSASKYMIPPAPFGQKMSFQSRAVAAGINLDEQISDLRNELNAINPNVILALGGSALWSLTGQIKIQDYRGSILQGMGHKVVGTYNPGHLQFHAAGSEIHGYWNRQVMKLDFKRAREQSKFKEIRRPTRHLHVCRSSVELADFIKRHEHLQFPAIDIEAATDGSCIPICIGIAFTPKEGITVPLWNVSGISNIPDSDLANIWLLLARFLLRHGIVGQNFGYDRDKIKRLGFIIGALKSDTMLKSFVVNPELPKNLAFNTSIHTEEPFYKNEGMYEGSIEDLFIGCARDACVTKEIDLSQDLEIDEMGLRPFYENFVLPLHDLYAYIESEGLRTDESIRESLIRKYVEWDERIRFELYNLAGDHINTSAPKQVASLLYDNWKLPRKKGTGEEVITALLNMQSVKNPNHRRGMELILEDRRVKKTISSYLLSPTDFDSRMRTSFFICLDTGRSSTQQQEPPIRPSIEVREDGKKKRKSLGMAFQTITKHGDIGPDVRTMFIPDEGEIFLQADSSQAEARVVFLLAEDYQALEDIDKHDYHALTASWFFGGSESDYSKKVLGYEHPIRFAGKTLRHAGHLGAGKSRAATELNTQARKYHVDISISEQTADIALKIFHNKQPKIKQIFQADIIKQLEKNRQLSAPVPYEIDAPKGGTRIFFERWGDELFRQAFSYIPQRTVSENIKAAALRIRKLYPWIRILAESHDALLTSVPISRKTEAANILRIELSRPIDFSTCSLKREKLVIPCDVEEGMDFYNFKKFRFNEETKTITPSLLES